MRTPIPPDMPEPDDAPDDATEQTMQDELLAAFARATLPTSRSGRTLDTATKSQASELDESERAALAKRAAVSLADVKPVRLPKTNEHHPGRKLTPKLAGVILLAVGNGAYRQTAARFAGVTPETLSKWMKREDEPYATFAKLVRKREAAFELGQLTNITSMSKIRPELALALLERKFPQRWGRALGQGAGAPATFNLAVILERAHANSATPTRADATVIDAEPLEDHDA